MDKEIKQGNQCFYIGDDESTAIAIIKYKVKSDDVIIANSTYVDPSLRGQNVARELLDRLADHARKEGWKIEPTCSYVVRAFERYDAYDDVKH